MRPCTLLSGCPDECPDYELPPDGNDADRPKCGACGHLYVHHRVAERTAPKSLLMSTVATDRTRDFFANTVAKSKTKALRGAKSKQTGPLPVSLRI